MSTSSSAAPSCDLLLDPNDILTALDEGISQLDPLAAELHITTCESCRRVVTLRAKSRSAWTTALRDAPIASTRMAHPDHRDLRYMWEGGKLDRPTFKDILLTHRWPRAIAIAAPLCIAAILFIVIAAGRSSSHSSRASSSNVTPTNDRAIPQNATTSPTPIESANKPAIPQDAEEKKEPQQKQAARSMVVPTGSKIMLGFSVGTSAAINAADGSAELIGPASANTTDTSITLQRGTVKVNGLRHVAVVLPGAKLDPNGSTCTVQVDDRGIAHLTVDSGRATITSTGRMTLTIEAGGSMELDPDGSVRVAPPSTPPPSVTPPVATTQQDPDPQAVLHDALKAAPSTAAKPAASASNPDEAIASAAHSRSELEKLAQSNDARVARRASFTLAEMDLAAGGESRQRARTRLDALVTCPEPALGADAATLLARSMGSPVERAVVWRRYLATNPPRPYFERALLDRAEALLDAGFIDEARSILSEVKRAPSLTDSQRRQLDRLLIKSRDH